MSGQRIKSRHTDDQVGQKVGLEEEMRNANRSCVSSMTQNVWKEQDI